jgi:Fe-S cluster assembly protein SufD
MSLAQQIKALVPLLPGRHLPWLETLRYQAQKSLDQSGFPSPREEEWKYTNVASIEKRRFKPLSADELGSPDPALVLRYSLGNVWCLTFVDGRFTPSLSDVSDLPAGVLALSLAEALNRFPDDVAAAFHRSAAREDHGFVSFTTAYFQDGAFIHVPAGVFLKRPLQILNLATTGESLSVLRHVVALEPNAEAQVIETYAGPASASCLTTAVTELILAENSNLDHYKLQAESTKAYHFGGIYADQARSSRLHQHHDAFGGLLARTEIHTHLDHGSECELSGLFLASGRRHLDTHTLIRHEAAHARSRETYRGIAADRARGVFSGRIIVAANAQKTDAEMSNRNLLLSDEAEIDSKPQLEIYADDVKCAHGVTVGQLDSNAVFYLQSRGVDELAARNMLTFAFANEMVERIRVPNLKLQVQAELLGALAQSDVRGDWL